MRKTEQVEWLIEQILARSNKRLCDMIATCESGRHKTCPYKVGVAAPP